MTAIAPARPAGPAGRAGFGSLLHAEWTKFRTVRGWVAGIFVAALLTAGTGLLNHSECRTAANGTTLSGCPGSPIGPNGEAVTDTFYFLHRPLTGNGTITVRVAALTGLFSPLGGVQPAGPGPQHAVSRLSPGAQPWAKSGIMIKTSTVPGAPYAAMLVTGGNGVRMQYDYTGDIAGLPGTVSAASPRWLRLVRSSGAVSGYDSLDGTHWNLVGTVILPGLRKTAQAGLFAASPAYAALSHSIGGGSGAGGPTVATAALDHVGWSWPGGSWTGTSVGGGGNAGPGGGPDVNGPGSAGNPFNGGFRQTGRAAFTVSGSGDIAPDVPVAPDGNGTNPSDALQVGLFFGLIAMIVIAAGFVTAEYRRGLIRTTFAATPHRGRVLAAKALVIAAVTFVTGLAATAIALPVGEAVLRRGGNWILPVSALTAVRITVGSAALMAVTSVLALALGVIARRGLAAVSATIVLIVLPFLLAVIPGVLPGGAQQWLLRIFPAAAFAVQQAAPAYHQVIGSYAPGNGYYPLAPLAGFAVLCAWAALALAAAAYLLRRRDA